MNNQYNNMNNGVQVQPNQTYVQPNQPPVQQVNNQYPQGYYNYQNTYNYKPYIKPQKTYKPFEKRDNIFLNNIVSNVNNIHKNKNKNNSDNEDKTLSNIKRGKKFSSETILKEKKNKETFFDARKEKIKSFKKRKKSKTKKENIFNKFKKFLNFKRKNNATKETRSNLNIKNKIIISKINPFKKKIFNFSFMNDDFQDMDYYNALNLDKRSFLRIYWSYLLDNQIILGTFCTSNFLYLFVIKLSFLISTFQINFFLNALFYSDEYISKAYHNNGVLDFFSGLLKSIYSFLATLVTTNLLGMLSNSKNELINTIRNRTYKIDYLLQVNTKLKKLRNKLIIYYLFLFILDILFLYYVSAFCAVYRNSQKYWLIGCLESFLIESMSSIVICMFLAALRYVSLKKRIKCLYILAKLINVVFL